MDSVDYLTLLSAVFVSQALPASACLIIAFMFFVMALTVHIRKKEKNNNGVSK